MSHVILICSAWILAVRIIEHIFCRSTRALVNNLGGLSLNALLANTFVQELLSLIGTDEELRTELTGLTGLTGLGWLCVALIAFSTVISISSLFFVLFELRRREGEPLQLPRPSPTRILTTIGSMLSYTMFFWRAVPTACILAYWIGISTDTTLMLVQIASTVSIAYYEGSKYSPRADIDEKECTTVTDEGGQWKIFAWTFVVVMTYSELLQKAVEVGIIPRKLF